MSAAHHSTFVIERELPTGPKHAFRFWSDPAMKQRWNACHPDWTVLEDVFEFHVGGKEARRWRTLEGHEQTFAARYFDIEPQQRIIYAFEMSFGGASIRVIGDRRVSTGRREDTYALHRAAHLSGHRGSQTPAHRRHGLGLR